MTLLFLVLAKQAEKKAILDQQGKKPKNNRKRKNVPNGREGESLLKRPATGTGLVSSTPSPLMFSTRPDSVISVGSNSEIFNGDDSIDVVGSIDGTEVNSEVARQGGGGTTPVRKLTGTRRTDGGGLGAKKTSAPLGGRGKMQRSSKKGGSGSAAASAGAMAGALAASSAAYAAYAAGYGPLSSSDLTLSEQLRWITRWCYVDKSPWKQCSLLPSCEPCTTSVCSHFTHHNPSHF